MFVLKAEVTIADKRFLRVAGVEIESSAKVLEDTAIVTLPTTARLERQGEFISEVETAKVFSVGDRVAIRLGYDDDVAEEFRGYVRRIKAGTPVEVHCEDTTWLLRRKPLNKGFKNVSLKSMLEFVLEGTGVALAANVPYILFDKFYFRNTNGAQALQKLKDEYGLTIYFQDEATLFVGLADQHSATTVKYGLGQNVMDSDLEWVDESDTRLSVTAVHIRKNNTRLEKQVGDPDGEKRTLYFYNVADEKQLETLALQEIRKYQFTGFRGGLTTFLLPRARVGQVARVSDPDYAGREGDYLIDKITTTVGTEGGRRKIELGIKV